MSVRVFEEADAGKKKGVARQQGGENAKTLGQLCRVLKVSEDYYYARENKSYGESRASPTSSTSTWKVGGVCAAKAPSRISEVQKNILTSNNLNCSNQKNKCVFVFFECLSSL